jgi:arabinan endo-1,5-alpha-L-arabinosidase
MSTAPAPTTPAPPTGSQNAATCAGCYTNPLQISIPGGGTVGSCPDPSIIQGQRPDNNWYVYCTSDPFYDGSSVHLMATAKSSDLVHWNYVGDIFQQRPSWASSSGYLWAPDIEYFNGQYYLYYAVSSTAAENGSAIFVATSASPTGPWLASGSPVVEAQGIRDVIDPAIVQDDSGQRYIFYGSFNGGIAARTLSADGTSSSPSSEVQTGFWMIEMFRS